MFDLGAALIGLAASVLAQGSGAQPQAATPPPAAAVAPPPIVEGARFHHIQVNSVDPARTVAFYAKHFDAEATTFAGQPAVRVQNAWIHVNKVRKPASAAMTTAIWHVGWGAPDPHGEFERQKQLGARFAQTLTDISTGLGGAPGRFYYMYVESPDQQWIELNTARTNDFGHMHLFSADPIAAGDWWIRIFGVKGRGLSTPETPRTVRRALNGVQVGPSSSLYFDQVNMIIYPVEYAKEVYASHWNGVTEIQPTRGSLNDHIGVAVPDLDRALTALRAQGVKVTQEPRKGAGGVRSAFIEGPDRIAVELLEERQ